MAKSKADWESIEREYRSGQLSIREIAKQHGVSDAAVRKRAKARGWQRDLTEEVRRRVRTESVRSEVHTSSASDEEIVEEAAKRGAEIVSVHRRDIRQGRELVESMFGELQSQCAAPEVVEQQVEQYIDQSGMDVRAANAARRSVSLPGRASTLRDLSQSLQRLVALERQAYNLDEDAGDEAGGLAEALANARRRARKIEQDGDS